MIMFWVAAALLSAAVASLIVYRSAQAASMTTADGEAPDLAVYRRQLDEIDDLSARGLILRDERRSARAEAARRLLAAANSPRAEALSATTGPRTTFAVAILAPLVGVALYVAVGTPGAPDVPFAKRLAIWRSVDPSRLDPAQLAVVMDDLAKAHPGDAQPLYYTARAQLAAGDPFSAEANLRRAASLAPMRAEIWATLGQALAAEAEGGPLSADARRAFSRAAALDPNAPGPRYFLAQAQIADGDTAGGLAAWRALDASLGADDPRRTELAREIAIVERTGALPVQGASQTSAHEDQNAFIRGMVNRLAARLAGHPDDPAGWGRLIHSYGVMGDEADRTKAIARARALFKDRPDALRAVAAAGGGS